MSDGKKAELYAAINDCDRLLLMAHSHNSEERLDHHKDARRLERDIERRIAIVEHRRRLEAIYKAQYGEDPWSDVPY